GVQVALSSLSPKRKRGRKRPPSLALRAQEDGARVMSEDPLAYFLTWSTYGTWLPGDERGWVKKGEWGLQTPDPQRKVIAARAILEKPVILTPEQRVLVDAVLVAHCQIRGWELHARNVRTNHVHAVVTAAVDGEIVREQLKAWTSRRLSDHAGFHRAAKNGRRRWWSEGGDIEWILKEDHFHAAVRYVDELQD